MPSFEKQLMFQEIVKEFEKSPYAFISNLNGISVLDISEARRNLEKVSRRSLMVKHAMARKIFTKFNVSGAEKYLNGSVVITFGDKDPQEISKKLVDFSKANAKWKAAGVIFEGQVYGEEFVKQLAKLPSRKELLTQLVLRMNSPIQGFANVLGALTRNFVCALEEVRKKKAATGAAS